MKKRSESPPKWALRLFKSLCPEQLQEGIIGDLLEQYEFNLQAKSRFKANGLFIYNTFRFLRYGILKRKDTRHKSNITAMFRNYFLTSVRALLKQKFYFFLNVFGLSIGIAACLLCYLHINYELSYDQYNTKVDQVHRLITGDVKGGNGWVKVSAPMPPTLKRNIPEIERYTRLTNITRDPQVTVEYNNTIFSESKFFLADPDILEIFSINMIRGEKSSALAGLNNVILSASSAKKYFGNEDPMGKTIRVDDQHDFLVSGVFEDIPFNAHFEFDFLSSFLNLETILPGTSLTANWGQFNYFAYLELAKGSDPASVQAKIQSTEVNIGDNRNFDLSQIGIQPLSEIHFVDNRGNLKQAYNFKYIYIYGAIALAILFISFINFVNLSIAGSTKRLKEVGIRKVVGASRGQLIIQFIAESFLIAFFASVASILLSSYLFIPAVNDLMNSQITLNLTDPFMLSVVASLVLLIALSSGSYIAFFIISSQPISALKGGLKTGNKGNTFKNILLGLQFCISTVLILSSIFIYKQLNFLGNKDLGMSKDQIVNVALSNTTAQENGDLLASRFEQISGVKNVSATDFRPGGANWNQTVWWEGQQEPISMFLIGADENFVETVDMELIEGDLASIRSNQNTQYILNEAALKQIGWESALGKSFSAFGQASAVPISGVVKNYNFRSLHHNVDPCVLVIRANRNHNQLAVKLDGSNVPALISSLGAAYSEVLPEMQFEFSFMDQSFAKLYEAETRTSKIVGVLTFVAILLAVLGLYALLTFAVQERTRELAIRKVLGVKTQQVLLLLSNTYVRLMIIANVIAIPVTWYMLSEWLNNFNYRIDLGVFTFLTAILMTFTIIYLIAALKTWQSNRINPTEALRNE
ncbi:ABC transporter permease [Roseivirga sp. E12]|uniref:ABC transporter permease n=1 Tax=Roseivirga sp. E12 TaxID=2819237 RepID=UPI001ABCEA8A|nr:ABC transporter permease [Roseivirga sp. E12]MBO3698834.1 ABC transporter permease [Roseivirga sp. E12]